MAFRQRTSTFRPQLSMRRLDETLQPRSEIKEVPEAYFLHVYLPGFSKDNVKITYVASSRVVKITGERQILGTRWIRFDQSYLVPDYCEPETLQGKFEGGILVLTMQKKATSQAAPKQEVEATQEKVVVAEAKPDEKVQETLPPQPTPTTTKVEEPIEDKKSASPPSPDLKAQKKATLDDTPSQIPSQPIKPQKGQEELEPKSTPTMETTMPTDEKPQMGEKELEPKPTPTPPTTATTMQTDEKPQTGEKELEPKPTPTPPTRATTMQTDEKPQTGEKELEPKPTPTQPTRATTMQTDEKPQKGQEEVESKPTPTMLTKVKTAEKPQKGQEEYEPKPTPTLLTKAQTAEKPQKDQEEIEPKLAPTMAPEIKTDEQPPKGQDTVTNVTRKPSVKEQLEEKKTERTSAEDAEKERFSKKEVKEPVKDKEQGDFEEKETKKEKLLPKEAEPSAPKKKKEKESSTKKEGKSEEHAMPRVGFVSQAVSKIAEGIWSEEEKKLAANIGAAVLVIAALGAYVSFRFCS